MPAFDPALTFQITAGPGVPRAEWRSTSWALIAAVASVIAARSSAPVARQQPAMQRDDPRDVAQAQEVRGENVGQPVMPLVDPADPDEADEREWQGNTGRARLRPADPDSKQ